MIPVQHLVSSAATRVRYLLDQEAIPLVGGILTRRDAQVDPENGSVHVEHQTFTGNDWEPTMTYVLPTTLGKLVCLPVPGWVLDVNGSPLVGAWTTVRDANHLLADYQNSLADVIRG